MLFLWPADNNPALTEPASLLIDILPLTQLQTLLIAYNVDVAVNTGLREPEKVAFRREYDWNREGGVIHWIHHDSGRRGCSERLGEAKATDR